jgi:threonine/homoserine/homoserine lactone efflux protein
MTLDAAITYLLALLFWVFVPGPAVLAIVGRSLTSGFRPALRLIAGILLGDLFYLCIALFGLAAIGKALGEFFVIVRLAGAAYLIFLGVGLWLKGTRRDDSASLGQRPDGCKSLVAGFSLTLGNPKAIMFHLGFLPAFFDLSTITASESVMIITMFMAVLGLSLSGYAYLGSRTRGLFRSKRAMTILNRTSGTLLIGTGIAVAARR